jgi:hypothetical protein
MWLIFKEKVLIVKIISFNECFFSFFCGRENQVLKEKLMKQEQKFHQPNSRIGLRKLGAQRDMFLFGG